MEIGFKLTRSIEIDEMCNIQATTKRMNSGGNGIQPNSTLQMNE